MEERAVLREGGDVLRGARVEQHTSAGSVTISECRSSSADG